MLRSGSSSRYGPHHLQLWTLCITQKPQLEQDLIQMQARWWDWRLSLIVPMSPTGLSHLHDDQLDI